MLTWIRAARDYSGCKNKPPTLLKQWLSESEIVSVSHYRSAWNSLIVQMYCENMKFIEEIEELIKEKINKEPSMKKIFMIQEIEKLYDLQFNQQNAKDEEVKIEETEEQSTIRFKTHNGKNNFISFAFIQDMKFDLNLWFVIK